MGRIAEPTKLRVLAGKKANPDEPLPQTGIPGLPETHPSRELREVWEYTVEQVKAMGVVTLADRDALYAYCQAVIAHRIASDDLLKHGSIVRGSQGNLVKNPASTIQREAAATMLRYAQHLGLTPAARVHLRTTLTQPVVIDMNDPVRLLSS